MATLIPRRVPYICRSCRLDRPSKQLLRTYATVTQRPASLSEQLSGGGERRASKRRKAISAQLKVNSEPSAQDDEGERARSSRSILSSLRPTSIESRSEYAPKPSPEMIADPKAALRRIQQDALVILDSGEIPQDSVIGDLFARAAQLASILAQPAPTEQSKADSEVQVQIADVKEAQEKQRSLLFDLDEAKSQSRSNKVAKAEPLPPSTTTPQRESDAATLLQTLYTLLEAPQIFISESLLSTYVKVCAHLDSPQFLPKIFHLYAHKPIPVPNTSPPRYREPWSRMPKYGVEPKLIELAMESALAKKDMPLCMSIIDTTLATDAYKFAKFMRKALVPLLGASSIVPLSHAASTWASSIQSTWEPDTFYWMCMSGAGAYLGTMGTLLWITISTWNDHHKRVRWVPGTPLGKRWVREEERYWFDRIAQLWGFKDENRHGEETGEEWEALREVLGRRYLELDRSSLLPGML